MTELMERALAEVAKLSPEEQDRFAAWIVQGKPKNLTLIHYEVTDNGKFPQAIQIAAVSHSSTSARCV